MNRGAQEGFARAALVFGLGTIVVTSTVWADDWPSWRGRGHDGVSNETGLVSSWSPEGENLIWFQPYIGRSTPAVFDGARLRERPDG